MKRRSMNKLLINGMLSSVLALGVGTGSAFANIGDAAVSTTTPATTPSTAPTTTSTATSTTASTTVTAAETVPAEESQVLILPGDFFYFLKSLIQKAEIVLTIDNKEQAKLLKKFTHEKIREAEILIAADKPELAVTAIHTALDDQQLAMGDDKEDQQPTADAELAAHYRSNLEALTFVLEKVKNPHAKAALARNIEKTKAKLAVITITIEAVGNVPASPTGAQVQITPAQPATAQTVQAGHNGTDAEKVDNADKDDDADHDDHAEDQADAAKQSAAKALKAKLKQERKAAHEKAKLERKAAFKQNKQDNEDDEDDDHEHHDKHDNEDHDEHDD